jgi:ABC-type antimicrobial peptide transport system permease subunit
VEQASSPEAARAALPAVVTLAIAGVASFMLAVVIFACAVPARRALRVQPVDALRAE